MRYTIYCKNESEHSLVYEMLEELGCKPIVPHFGIFHFIYADTEKHSSLGAECVAKGSQFIMAEAFLKLDI